MLDGVHIPGDLLIAADNVTVRNSQIDGMVLNNPDNTVHPFTITDSTVGPASGCLTSPGVGEARFTATRVHVRGHDDGFRDSGDNVTVQDSYFHGCSNPDSHSDGIQDHYGGANLVFTHNTIDMRDADANASVFVTSPTTKEVTIRDNLLMNGAATMHLKWYAGNWIVHDNRVVDKEWAYYPVTASGTCGHIDWSGNSVVTINENYDITSTVRPLPCAN